MATSKGKKADLGAQITELVLKSAPDDISSDVKTFLCNLNYEHDEHEEIKKAQRNITQPFAEPSEDLTFCEAEDKAPSVKCGQLEKESEFDGTLFSGTKGTAVESDPDRAARQSMRSRAVHHLSPASTLTLEKDLQRGLASQRNAPQCQQLQEKNEPGPPRPAGKEDTSGQLDAKAVSGIAGPIKSCDDSLSGNYILHASLKKEELWDDGFDDSFLLAASKSLNGELIESIQSDRSEVAVIAQSYRQQQMSTEHTISMTRLSSSQKTISTDIVRDSAEKEGNRVILSKKDKHPLLSPCNCRNSCGIKIGHEQRISIHSEYWSYPYDEQRTWLFNNTVKISPKKRDYFLADSSGTQIKVCLQFFLRTLGYTSNSVMACFEKRCSRDASFVPTDKRGRHQLSHARNKSLTFQTNHGERKEHEIDAPFFFGSEAMAGDLNSNRERPPEAITNSVKGNISEVNQVKEDLFVGTAGNSFPSESSGNSKTEPLQPSLTSHSEDDYMSDSSYLQNFTEELVPSHRETALTLEMEGSEGKFDSRDRHPILSPCNCKSLCRMKIVHDQRRAIHSQFWSLGHEEQRNWILANSVRTSSGKWDYFLTSFSCLRVKVCAKFFFRTLGYLSTSVVDWMVKKPLGHSPCVPTAMRDVDQVPRAVNVTLQKAIDEQWESFHTSCNSNDSLYDTQTPHHPQLLQKECELELPVSFDPESSMGPSHPNVIHVGVGRLKCSYSFSEENILKNNKVRKELGDYDGENLFPSEKIHRRRSFTEGDILRACELKKDLPAINDNVEYLFSSESNNSDSYKYFPRSGHFGRKQDLTEQRNFLSLPTDISTNLTEISEESRKRISQKDKHPILNPCNCKNMCGLKISQEQRLSIHSQYWSLGYRKRRNWLMTNSVKISYKHRGYWLTDSFGMRVKVCAQFFLRTLGYTSNSVINWMVKTSTRNTCFESTNRLDRDQPNQPPDSTMIKMFDQQVESIPPSCNSNGSCDSLNVYHQQSLKEHELDIDVVTRDTRNQSDVKISSVRGGQLKRSYSFSEENIIQNIKVRKELGDYDGENPFRLEKIHRRHSFAEGGVLRAYEIKEEIPVSNDNVEYLFSSESNNSDSYKYFPRSGHFSRTQDLTEQRNFLSLPTDISTNLTEISEESRKRISQKDKHPILNPCNCKNMCGLKISQEQRLSIHSQYWSLGYRKRRNWLMTNSVKISYKHRGYWLTDSFGMRVKVCAQFFLRTLGYTSNSVINWMVKTSTRNTCFESTNRLGRDQPTDSTVQKLFNDQVESFRPSCSSNDSCESLILRHQQSLKEHELDIPVPFVTRDRRDQSDVKISSVTGRQTKAGLSCSEENGIKQAPDSMGGSISDADYRVKEELQSDDFETPVPLECSDSSSSSSSDSNNEDKLLPVPTEHSSRVVDPVPDASQISENEWGAAVLSPKGKHPILSPCNCRNLCKMKIGHEQRISIHAQYWDLPYGEQRNWLLNNCVKTSSKNRDYWMADSSGKRTKVCAHFFLRTLGYTSNSVINWMGKKCLGSTPTVPSDLRGRHRPAHALDVATQEAIDAHNESFHPSSSHYPHHHFTYHRYLSPDITVREMHDSFIESHPNMKQISYQTYRSCLLKKGISFGRFGVEKCEQCSKFKLHEHDDPNEHADCDTCLEQAHHKLNYNSGIIRYQRDAIESLNEGSCLFVSTDMQRAITLPFIMNTRSCASVNRLVVFHEAFVPLGEPCTGKSPKQVLSILWHEAVAGRSLRDVTSVFIKAIRAMAEDADQIVIWCDSCFTQSKNWTLFTSLVRFLNTSDYGPVPSSVTIKYLESGHSRLSTDSFHGIVEKNMRKRDKLYNFHDFASTIRNCDGAPKTIEMGFQDFHAWNDGGCITDKNDVKIPNLKDVQVAKFARGSKKLFFKVSHDDEVFQEVDFILQRVQREIDENENQPQPNPKPRGIPEWKKYGIINNLGNAMPEVKTLFWRNLPVNNASADLNQSDDTLNCE